MKQTSAFQHFAGLLGAQTGEGSSHSWLHKAREKFLQQGLPDSQWEQWRYGRPEVLLRGAWQPALAVHKFGFVESQLAQLLERSKDFDVIVLRNGQLDSQLSRFSVRGLEVRPIDLQSAAAEEFLGPVLWSEYWRKIQSGGLSAFHRGMANYGCLIQCSTEHPTNRPLHLISISETDHKSNFTLPVSFLRLKPSAQLHVLYSQIFAQPDAASTAPQWSNDVIVGQVEEQAVLELVCAPSVQAQQFLNAELTLHVSQAAQLNLVSLQTASGWVRGDVYVTLCGGGSEAIVSGLNLGQERGHLDHRIAVEHAVAQTTSRQLFKNVLTDESHGVFHGKIKIAHGANQVVSSQTNHNLLLSQRAAVDAKPELEVYADDVKAAHGTSTGRLDDSQLFYFLSRGISRSQATHMLAEAFMKDILMKVRQPQLSRFVQQSMAQALNQFVEAMGRSET